MKYITVTYVDAVTGIPVNEAPATNGPKFPDVDSLEFVFANESEYPTSLPKFFCTCADDADVKTPGVICELTKETFDQAQTVELAARTSQANARRRVQIAAELEEIDKKSVRPLREGDTERVAALEAQADALRVELRSIT